MSNILTRSPRFIASTNVTGLSAVLEISVGGVLVYTITKNKDGNDNVLFEISELLRDYLDIKYDDVATQSKSYSYTLTWYNGLNGSGTFVTASGDSGFILDGYGYYEEGYNPTVNKAYLQSNNVIYKLGDADIRIPIDRNKATNVSFLYNGDTVKSEAISTSATDAIQYVGTSTDGYRDRVIEDSGTYEDNVCINRFLGEFEINGIDTIYVESASGVEVIEVVTVDECKFTPVKVSFVNRYGAIQDLWFFKKSIESINTKSENYNRFNISTVGSYDVLEHQKKTFNIESNKSIKLNTGYVSESYNALMQELMQSEYVWMEIESVITPMTVRTSSLTFKTSVNDRLVDYSIDLEYSNQAINNIR